MENFSLLFVNCLKFCGKRGNPKLFAKVLRNVKKNAIFSTKSVRKMEIMGLCKNVVPTIT